MNALHTPEIDAPRVLVRGLEARLNRVIRGKAQSIRLVLTTLLAGGHVLLEDVPGTGKTTLAKALARLVGGDFRRVQFTPDLMPGDITGSSFYNQPDGTFTFQPGPVFTNVLLADEINRTSPRTQAALLETMSEAQVTVEGVQRALPQPFFVIATQNPSDFHGTYPLPEAQLDRFMTRVRLGYPDHEDEVQVLLDQSATTQLEIAPALSCAQLLDLQRCVRDIELHPCIAEYVVRLVASTRSDTRLRLAISPRGSLSLCRMAQARAWFDGRDFVRPDDVRALAVAVLAHRIVPDTKARLGGVHNEIIIEEILESVPVPR